MWREFPSQDGNEDHVVHAEDEFEEDEGEKGYPRLRVGEPVHFLNSFRLF
jgi:hypothetical protein